MYGVSLYVMGAASVGLGALQFAFIDDYCAESTGPTCTRRAAANLSLVGFTAGGAFVGAVLEIVVGSVILGSDPRDTHFHGTALAVAIGANLMAVALGSALGAILELASAPPVGTCRTTADGVCAEAQQRAHVEGYELSLGLGVGGLVAGAVISSLAALVPTSPANVALVPRMNVGPGALSVGLDARGSF